MRNARVVLSGCGTGVNGPELIQAFLQQDRDEGQHSHLDIDIFKDLSRIEITTPLDLNYSTRPLPSCKKCHDGG